MCYKTGHIMCCQQFTETPLTRDFLYSIVTFLTDAPLAQLDRALDYELFWPTSASPRLCSVFSRLGPPSSEQEVPACDRK
jgi:hypothetical protein